MQKFCDRIIEFSETKKIVNLDAATSTSAFARDVSTENNIDFKALRWTNLSKTSLKINTNVGT